AGLALGEAHGLAVGDVDGGQQCEARDGVELAHCSDLSMLRVLVGASGCTARVCRVKSSTLVAESVRATIGLRRRMPGARDRAGQRRVSTQLVSRRSPAWPDFSGWNWVALRGPFSTAATKGWSCRAQVTRGGWVRPWWSSTQSR